MKKVILIIVVMFFFSCKEKKMEFIQSKAIPTLILIKNPPKADSLLRNQTIDFLLKNQSIFEGNDHMTFYRYTWNTKYFINNEGDNTGGFSQNSITDYEDQNIAIFIISKCEQDTTKLVGELFFYGNGGLVDGRSEIDTLIYHCK